jgi:hypothetical protein
MAKNQNFEKLLAEKEHSTFGDRCPLGFQKLDLLGKGGTSLVWLGFK